MQPYVSESPPFCYDSKSAVENEGQCIDLDDTRNDISILTTFQVVIGAIS
jgi:hypothetical protein